MAQTHIWIERDVLQRLVAEASYAQEIRGFFERLTEHTHSNDEDAPAGLPWGQYDRDRAIKRAHELLAKPVKDAGK